MAEDAGDEAVTAVVLIVLAVGLGAVLLVGYRDL